MVRYRLCSYDDTSFDTSPGSLFTFRIIGRAVLVINSLQDCRELLEKRSHIYSDRPHIPSLIADNRSSDQYLPLLSRNGKWTLQHGKQLVLTLFRWPHSPAKVCQHHHARSFNTCQSGHDCHQIYLNPPPVPRPGRQFDKWTRTGRAGLSNGTDSATSSACNNLCLALHRGSNVQSLLCNTSKNRKGRLHWIGRATQYFLGPEEFVHQSCRKTHCPQHLTCMIVVLQLWTRMQRKKQKYYLRQAYSETAAIMSETVSSRT